MVLTEKEMTLVKGGDAPPDITFGWNPNQFPHNTGVCICYDCKMKAQYPSYPNPPAGGWGGTNGDNAPIWPPK